MSFSEFATRETVNAAAHKMHGIDMSFTLIIGVNGTRMYKYVRLWFVTFCTNRQFGLLIS